VIAWQPVRWRLNSHTAGTITGLPLAPAEVDGPQLASNGLSGDLVFNADCALLTDTLRLKMNVNRHGDRPQATSPEGTSTPFEKASDWAIDCQRRRRLECALRLGWRPRWHGRRSASPPA
jgi:hypothetical protein